MKRRRFLAASLAAVAAPRARAQQSGKIHRIGILGGTLPAQQMTADRDRNLRAFFAELQRLGYREGENLVVERRSAEGDARRFPELARELVATAPVAVFTISNPAVNALKTASPNIPIVALLYDPVGSKLAASLARPGGNVTGVTLEIGLELMGKNISILKEVVPSATRIAFLTARVFWEDRFGAAWRDAARSQGLTALSAAYEYPAEEAEFRRVFAGTAQNRVEVLDVGATPETYRHHRLIVRLAAEAKLPAIYTWREPVEAGGLMAYAVDLADMFRGAAGYVAQILKGATPAELPIQQPTKFELIVNLKTAKALGLIVPQAVLVRADEVIE